MRITCYVYRCEHNETFLISYMKMATFQSTYQKPPSHSIFQTSTVLKDDESNSKSTVLFNKVYYKTHKHTYDRGLVT